MRKHLKNHSGYSSAQAQFSKWKSGNKLLNNRKSVFY